MEVFRHRCWLGHGSYGDVQLCEVSPQVAAVLLEAEQREGNDTSERATVPVTFALKTLKYAHDDGKVMRLALREVQVLRGLRHPNVAKLQFAFTTPSGRVCMAFEYGGKSMHQLLESRFPNGIPQPLLKRIAYQLLQALRYLHERKVIHRDIKPANVLLDSSGVLRLCDFGFARYTVSKAGHPERLTPYVITRWYRAPEVLVGLPYGSGADIWSLGVTLAELATGQPLLPGDSPLDQLKRIVATTGPLPPLLASRLARHVREATPEFQEPLPPITSAAASAAASTAALWRQLAAARPGACLDLEHPLLALLTACLTPHPDQRPSAAALLQLPYFDDVATLFRGHPLEGCYAYDWGSGLAASTAASYNEAGGGIPADYYNAAGAGAGAGAGARSMLSHTSALVPDLTSPAKTTSSPWKQQQQHVQEEWLQQQQPHLQQHDPPQLPRKQSPQIRRRSVSLEERQPQQQPQPHTMSQDTRPVYQPRPPPPLSAEMQPRLRPLRATAAIATGSLTHASSGGIDGDSPPDAGSVSANVSGIGGGRRPWSTKSSTDGSGLGSSLATSCNTSVPADGGGESAAAAAAGGGVSGELRGGRKEGGSNGEGKASDCWHGRAGAAAPGETAPKTTTTDLTTAAAAAVSHKRADDVVQHAFTTFQATEYDVGMPNELDSLVDCVIAATAATGPNVTIGHDPNQVGAVETSRWGGVPSGIDWASAAPGKFIKGNAGGVLSREATIRAAAAVAAFAADAGVAAAAVAATHKGPPRRLASNGYVEAPPDDALPALTLSLPPHNLSMPIGAVGTVDVGELLGAGTNTRSATAAADGANGDVGSGCGPSRDQAARAPNQIGADGTPAEADNKGVVISAVDPWGARTASGAENCEVRGSLVCPAHSMPAAASNQAEEFLPAATALSAHLLAPSAASTPSSRAVWLPATASLPRPTGTEQQHDSTMPTSDLAPGGKANSVDHGTPDQCPLHQAASAKPQRQQLNPPPQWLAGFYHDCSPSSYGNLAASALTSTEAAATKPCAVSPRLGSLTNATTLHLNWKSAASPDGDDIALVALSAATSRPAQHSTDLAAAAASETVVAPDQLTCNACSLAGICQPLSLQSSQPPQLLHQARHQAVVDWRRPRIGLKMRAQPQLQPELQQSTRGVEPRVAHEQHTDECPAGQQHNQQQSMVNSAFLPYAQTSFSVNNDEGGSAPLTAPVPHVGMCLHGPDVGLRLEYGSIAAAAMNNTNGDVTSQTGRMAALAWAAPPTGLDHPHMHLRRVSEEAAGCIAGGSAGCVGHEGDGHGAKDGCGIMSGAGSGGDFEARPFVGCKGILPGWLKRGKRWFRQTMGAL